MGKVVFTVSILSNSVAFRFRFRLTQKGEINIPILNHLVVNLSSRRGQKKVWRNTRASLGRELPSGVRFS